MSFVLWVLIAARLLFAGNRWVTRSRRSSALLAWAIFLPLFQDSGGGFLDDATLALAYVVMALGLNIIVGFAGLLDLGYVAFFALGALHRRLAHVRLLRPDANVHIGVTEPAAELPGIHVNFLIVIVAAIVVTTIAGMLIGLPTLRLRGDYIAIVTLAFGEIIGRIAINGDEIVIVRQPAHERPPGHHADRQDPAAGVRRSSNRCDLRPWYWTALGLVAGRAVRELHAARLAARARLDRAARGRGRGRVDGRAARQDEAAGLRHRRGVRRRRRARSSRRT